MSGSNLPHTIRHARREDVPALLTMIHLLGTHNKDLSSVHSTETTLLTHLSFAIAPTVTDQPQSNHQIQINDNSNSTDARTSEILEPLSSTKTARALLLYDGKMEDKPAGMAIYYYTFSTWTGKPGIYLEDLFVCSEYRGRGYGKMLLQKLAQLVKEEGGERLQWTCLKWNQSSLDFYTSEAIGAEVGERHCYLRVEGEKLDRLAAGDNL